MGQGCAITLAFLYITAKLPGALASYFAWTRQRQEYDAVESEKMRTHQAEERERDRMARHKMANSYQDSIASMFLQHRQETDNFVKAIHELKIAMLSVCRANNHHEASDE